MTHYAHSIPGKPPDDWQVLEDHLHNVGELAEQFAAPFGAGDWAYAGGLLHDIGKYCPEFQEMLHRSADNEVNSEFFRGPDHSSAGAKEINARFSDGLGKLLAYAIASHHSGLLDGKSTDACLEKRLCKEIADYSECPSHILNLIPRLELPSSLVEKGPTWLVAFRIQLFVRMLFSCLVDADRLDTERFCDGEKAALRSARISVDNLRARVEKEIQRIEQVATQNRLQDSTVNQQRREVLRQCLRAAEWPPGIFSLTVPTGGGKTLSSLAFALEHATRYHKDRVIYVIPYTSIIEQNARVFRNACGEDSVVEHHSNFEFPRDSYWAQLAAENWDAPLIVTTNVQFFETLFHHRTSRCRKTHNIANSVVILDEAQMLPIDLLKPCLAVLEELARAYRVTVVLCSATQPALGKSADFASGIEGIREIISRPDELYRALRRVSLRKLPYLADAELVDRLNKNKQVLCVVNTRKHARKLFEAIEDKTGSYHLSGLMCPVHRTAVLARIKEALDKKVPCRVVSTQLIEAGVDIDFPVVYRALAGIDSIAQSAGRCNREGKLQDKGEVFVFEPENSPPPGYLRQSAEEAASILRNYEDILSLQAVHEYFLNVYWKQGERLDKLQVLGQLAEGIKSCDFPFYTVGEMFRMIENGTQSIVIPFDKEARHLIDRLKRCDVRPRELKDIARRLQRFCVQIYPDVIVKLGRVALEPMQERFYVLINEHLYKPDVGLDWDDPYFRNVESNII